MNKGYTEAHEETFTAQLDCTYRGVRYKRGEQLTILITISRNELEREAGGGGPWGWGGYTSRYLASIEA